MGVIAGQLTIFRITLESLEEAEETEETIDCYWSLLIVTKLTVSLVSFRRD